MHGKGDAERILGSVDDPEQVVGFGQPVMGSIQEDTTGDEASACDLGEGSAPGQAQGDNDPPPVDLLRRGVSDGTVLDPGLNRLDESVSTARGERLGVGEPGGYGRSVRPDEGDADGDRAGESTATDLVHAGDDPPARREGHLEVTRGCAHEGLGTNAKASGRPTPVLQ